MTITHILLDDWEALYFDDFLVLDNHSLSTREILIALQEYSDFHNGINNITLLKPDITITDEMLENKLNWKIPKSLTELKQKIG